MCGKENPTVPDTSDVGKSKESGLEEEDEESSESSDTSEEEAEKENPTVPVPQTSATNTEQVGNRSSHDLVSSLALCEVQRCSRYCRMGFTAPYWYSRHRRGQVLASLVKGLWLGAIAATCRPQQRTKPSIRYVSEDDQDSKGRQPYGGGRVGVGSSFVMFEA